MQILTGDRGSGKTTWAIEQAIKNNCVLITNNISYIKSICEENGWPLPKTLTYSEASIAGKRCKECILDDLDSFLNHILPGQCIGYTTTRRDI